MNSSCDEYVALPAAPAPAHLSATLGWLVRLFTFASVVAGGVAVGYARRHASPMALDTSLATPDAPRFGRLNAEVPRHEEQEKAGVAPLSVAQQGPLQPAADGKRQKKDAAGLAPIFAPQQQPEHLVVLAHGLAGHPDDLLVLKQELEARDPHLLALLARANDDKTRDGVQAGGERLAAEVRAEVRRWPSLVRISFVGNSLGALYVRYAAAVLFRPKDGTVEGLHPHALVSIAGPNCGSSSAFFLPVPRALFPMARAFAGRSGTDLFLDDTDSGDGRPLLLRMATDPPFSTSLREFERRIAVANLYGDFMVASGTALMETEEVGTPGIVHALRAGPVLPHNHNSTAGQVVFERVVPPRPEPARVLAAGEADVTRKMAAALAGAGWLRVGVVFPSSRLVPLAHNKISALTRSGARASLLLKWIEGTAEGIPIMGRVAELLLEDPR